MKVKIKVGGIVDFICGGLFFLVGLGLLAGGIIAFLSNQSFKESARKIEGVISDINTRHDSDGDSHHDVWVTYKVDGREYTEEINYYSSSMYEGKAIEIYVDNAYPTRIRSVGGSIFVVLMLCGMGLVFALVGGSLLLVPLRRRAKVKKVIEGGYYVYAEITEAFVCRNYTVNGRHPYKLECKYEDVFSGITHMFSSDYVWENPQAYIGRQVKVYCNRDFTGPYYVDLDSLQGSY